MTETGTQPATLKIAIMSFAHTHAIGYIEILRSLPGIEIRASDPDARDDGGLRGRALADSLGVAYDDTYEELLTWKPDAVIIASENARHREHVELAAAVGAHILCEKPLATSWADARAIERAVDAAGVSLMVAFPVRFAPAFVQLKNRYRAGQLGEIFAVEGRNNGMLPRDRAWFTQPALSGGGAMVDHIVHVADMIDDLTDATPLRVTAISNKILHNSRAEAETGALVTIEYDTGFIATIDCSWSVPYTAPAWGGVDISVTGTHGNVRVDFFDTAVRGIRADSGLPIVHRFGPSYDEILLRAFLATVRGERAPEPSLRSGLRTLAIVLAAQESALTGATVRVDDDGSTP